MTSRLEEDWKTLWCPKAFPLSGYAGGALTSANRSPEGKAANSTLCIGSACAAFWYDRPRPPDGYTYATRKISSYSDHVITPADYGQYSEQVGWEFVEYTKEARSDSTTYSYFTLHFRKAWKPLGFCAAFPHPDSFPVSES